MSKKNKRTRVPHDEMLLAEAIAAAEANKLQGYKSKCFGWKYDDNDNRVLVGCCAVGALAVVKAGDALKATKANAYSQARAVLNNEGLRRWGVTNVWEGNDIEDRWTARRNDGGESFGWAFRNAMDPQLGA